MNLDRWFFWMAGDRLDDWTNIHFTFGVPFSNAVCAILLALAAVGVLFFAWPRLKSLRVPMQVVLSGLRAVAILIALFLCFDPCLVGDLIKPGDRYVALLYDNSQSMQVRGNLRQTRGERLAAACRSMQPGFEPSLQNKFHVIKYRFGGSIEPLRDIAGLDFLETVSDPIQAIRASVAELAGFKLSAIILFSDGAQQTGALPADLTRQPLPDVPVFTVGVGDDAPWRDARIARLSVNRTRFDQSPAVVSAEIDSSGFAGKQLQAAVIEGSKIIQSKTIPIARDRQSDRLRFEFTPSKKEWISYELRVRAFQGDIGTPGISDFIDDPSRETEERTPQNNARSFLLDNTQKDYRILYYSSRPNWEHRFVRRALQDDEQLKLSSLVLISGAQRNFVFRGAKNTLANPLFDGFDKDEGKVGRYDEPIYLRLGLDETELVKGFPSQKEDLFAFHLLIIGDVNWADFRPDQLKLIRDFVDLRGGSLLVLGGREKFASESFLTSPIQSMLPVLPLDSSGRGDSFVSDFFGVRPSPSGELSGTWLLSSNSDENRNQWDALPNLYGFNPFGMIRPGATVFSFAESSNPQIDRQPFFVSQRYGNGKCAVVATDETWRWRMRQPDDSTVHERLWRQWIRSLVDDVPEPIQFLTAQDSYTVNEPVSFKFRIRNARFEEGEETLAQVAIQTPSQNEAQPNLEESIQESGIYTAEWTPTQTGKHRIIVKASDARDGKELTGTQAFLADANQREFDNAQYNPDFLQEIASRTKGRFYPLDRISEIPGAIPWERNPESTQKKIHLWYCPVFYFLLVSMLSLEWYLRRRRGYP